MWVISSHSILLFIATEVRFPNQQETKHQTPPKKRSGLQVPTQVLSLAVESTCDGHRKYVHFLSHFFSFFKATMTNTTIININNLKLQ